LKTLRLTLSLGQAKALLAFTEGEGVLSAVKLDQAKKKLEAAILTAEARGPTHEESE
jgi:hypothetical protein